MKQVKEIKAFCLIGLALFLGIAFYFPQIRTGFLGVFLLQVFAGFLGKVAFLVPLLFLLLGVNVLLEKKTNFSHLKTLHLIFFFFFLAAFLQLIFTDFSLLEKFLQQQNRGLKKVAATQFLLVLWRGSYDITQYTDLKGLWLGGVIGGSLAFGLSTLLGRVGAFLLILGSLFIQAALLFNLSYLDILRKTKKSLKQQQITTKLQSLFLFSKEEDEILTKEDEDNIEDYYREKENDKRSAYYQEEKGEGLHFSISQLFRKKEDDKITPNYQQLLKHFEQKRGKSRYNLLLKERLLELNAKREGVNKVQQDYSKVEREIGITANEVQSNEANRIKELEKTSEIFANVNSPSPSFTSEFSATPPRHRLKPTRMYTAVPIGKILSQDPEWEKPTPLEEDLKVKRVLVEDTNFYRQSKIPERSNLEILAENEPSLKQVSLPETGVFYGLSKGDLSNLERTTVSVNDKSSSDEDLKDRFTFEFTEGRAKEVEESPKQDILQITSSLPKENNPPLLSEDETKSTVAEEVNKDVNLSSSSYSNFISSSPKSEVTSDLSNEKENFKQSSSSYQVAKNEYGSSLSLAQDLNQPKEAVSIIPSKVNQNKDFSSISEKNSANEEGISLNDPNYVEKALVKKGIMQAKPYVFPSTSFLQGDLAELKIDESILEEQAKHLETTLANFGVNAQVIHVTTGPSITRFELAPGPGVKVSKIVGLADDIALSLAAVSVRIEAPIPGKSAVGIEIPNKETLPVHLRDLLETPQFIEDKSSLMVALGRDIAGEPVLCDLAKMPHLLVAGATGSGKSVCINCILMSILFKASPKEVQLILIDPKVVELKIYNSIPHLIAPVVTDPKKAANALNWAVNEMTRRYQLFANKSAREIKSYNNSLEPHEEKLPYILIVIDELADLMVTATKEVEDSISRLTAMARAAGMHLLIATQRPSVDVLTGVIKANIPSRIAFSVSSQIDSRTILDGAGAEKLLGKGDMLYAPQTSPKFLRAQGAFVSDAEVERVTEFVKRENEGSYDLLLAEKITSATVQLQEKANKSIEEDADLAYLPAAMDIILASGQASTSILQRRLKLGYPRASRIIDYLEAEGIVGPFEGSRPRKLLISKEEWEMRKKDMQASS